ncbi:MAG: DUF928 domain-containing protein [Symploca sp. SIO2B6]|nr:DUF928 domain-containing protein [Symploca sp. SIO2B6]
MDIKRIASIALSLPFLVTTVALANTDIFDDLPPNTSGRSGGSRGCSTQTVQSKERIPALILLAPTQQGTKAVATNPSFSWFVRDPGSWQLEFRLYRYDPVSEETQLVKEIKDDSFTSLPGIMTLSLSESIPELPVGQRYLWQVELVCDPNHPSGNPFAEAEIEVVALSTELKTELANTQNKFKQATLYKRLGFWYNAWDVVLNTEQTPMMNELKSFLLEKVALAEQEIVKVRTSAINKVQR